jgi:hypothetical protein
MNIVLEKESFKAHAHSITKRVYYIAGFVYAIAGTVMYAQWLR